ncbi:MAG: SDR family oxidoreductase [Clostridia bacterium]|nr:SDR family oxidoreductase [Clostridia bacterium]
MTKLPFEIDLSGEVAAVTGGSGVLMSGFAEALAACGAKVGLIDRNAEKCAAEAEKIKAAGWKAVAAPADCLDKTEIECARETIEKAFGRVTLLVNGAGGNSPRAQCDNETMTREPSPGARTFFDIDEDGFKYVFDLNILTAVLCAQVFAKGMAEAGKGNIINISSMNAFRPLTKIPAYSAAKAALSNLTQWLAVHFAPCGIRCNAIAPGFFSTKQNSELLFGDDGTPTARTGKILRGTPLGRLGDPEDLIGTFLWLASNAASGFVTGTVIPVDGGFSAYSGV